MMGGMSEGRLISLMSRLVVLLLFLGTGAFFLFLCVRGGGSCWWSEWKVYPYVVGLRLMMNGVSECI